MSVLESFEAADASLLEQIKTQQTTEGAEDKQPKDVEEVIDESTEEIIEESTETEGNDTDDSDESDVVDDKASDDTEEDDPKDNAKKGWKVRQELKAEKEKREEIEKRLDEMQRNPNAMRGIPTGLADLDNILAGFGKSNLIILSFHLLIICL